ncbi:MAG TPA: ABC transporter permease [Acidobacteriota bacterium]|nr:ABC transporter permease [Acidobacteriota bacterium]
MGWNTFGQVLTTLRANKLRSFLSMFGITWGVLSLILLTATGEGFRVAQYESFRKLGQDILIIWGGRTSVQYEGFQAGRWIPLRYEDYEILQREARLLKAVSPELIRDDLVARTPLNYGTFAIRGVLPEYQEMRTIEIAHGRLINPADCAEGRLVCVIGSEVNKQLFNDKISVGETVRIEGYPFTVIGLMSYKELNSNYWGQDHSSIFIPYQTMRRLFPNPDPSVSPFWVNNLIAAPLRHDLYEEAETEVRRILGRHRFFDPEDEDALAIWNTGRSMEMLDLMMRSLQIFLGVVGLVTLTLGALGVLNIMLVAVRERVAEIGIRRAVGARRRDILTQFLLESLTISGLAGGTGLAVGLGLCAVVNRLPVQSVLFAGMIVSPWIAGGAATALALVALAAAVYPAWQAARMDPVEALRFEPN